MPNPRNPCAVCHNAVQNNHRAIFCDSCHLWTHLKCTSLPTDYYNVLTNSREDWFCAACLAEIFPFNHFEDDTDFYFSILDQNLLLDSCFNMNLIKDKCFNPFLDDADSRQLLLNSDIDPDSSMLQDNSSLLSNCVWDYHCYWDYYYCVGDYHYCYWDYHH